jgi:ADP-ribose pyrophosphatase
MHLTDPVDETEWGQLRAQYGEFPLERVVLEVSPDFFKESITPAKKGRRAEVLLVVIGPDGRVLVHTKAFYPRGILRLLSGGIQTGEPVEEALTRELFEETGAQVLDRCLIGVLAYEIRSSSGSIPFASYVYRVDIPTADVRVGDEEEQISELRWVSFSELPTIRETLVRVPPPWQDWGRFRALGHDFVWRYRRRCRLSSEPQR